MKMYDKAIKVEKLRKQGCTFEEIGKVIGGSRQYAQQLLVGKPHFKEESLLQKIEKLLSALELDTPTFVSGITRSGVLYTIATALKIRVVTKCVERDGVIGLWVCRYM